MGDFHVWGRVEHIGLAEFFLVASALSPNNPEQRPIVLTLTAHSLSQANAERQRLMVEAGAVVRKRGGRVIDLVEE